MLGARAGRGGNKSHFASPSQVTSHLFQVQVKSQVIPSKLKSSTSHFRQVASQVKSRVIWSSLSQVQVTQYKPIDY